MISERHCALCVLCVEKVHGRAARDFSLRNSAGGFSFSPRLSSCSSPLFLLCALRVMAAPARKLKQIGGKPTRRLTKADRDDSEDGTLPAVQLVRPLFNACLQSNDRQ